MPNISKADDKISLIHDFWIDSNNREMWIHGIDISGIGYEGEEPGVEYLMATKVIKNLHYFRNQSTSKEVIIHLHTCGGEFQEGMAIYDTIKLMPYPVTIISYTHARSMSSIILQSAIGSKDKRLLMPNSYFMFHYGTLYSSGTAKSVYSLIDFNKKQDEIMIDIYVNVVKESKKFKGQTDQKIRKTIIEMMEKKEDVYLTAQEAVEWGFADGILHSWSDLKSIKIK